MVCKGYYTTGEINLSLFNVGVNQSSDVGIVVSWIRNS
jgi:hypothetical protein